MNNYSDEKNVKDWVRISRTEIQSWIGLNILIVYHRLPAYKNEWSSILSFNVGFIGDRMSRNIFKKP